MQKILIIMTILLVSSCSSPGLKKNLEQDPAGKDLKSQAAIETYVITFKNYRSSPEVLAIPASKKVRIIIKNLDTTEAFFDSDDLDRHMKLIGQNSEITIFIGPLNSGHYNYSYRDDLSHTLSMGAITAR